MKKISHNNLMFVGRNWSTMGENNTFHNLLQFFWIDQGHQRGFEWI